MGGSDTGSIRGSYLHDTSSDCSLEDAMMDFLFIFVILTIIALWCRLS